MLLFFVGKNVRIFSSSSSCLGWTVSFYYSLDFHFYKCSKNIECQTVYKTNGPMIPFTWLAAHITYGALDILFMHGEF